MLGSLLPIRPVFSCSPAGVHSERLQALPFGPSRRLPLRLQGSLSDLESDGRGLENAAAADHTALVASAVSLLQSSRHSKASAHSTPKAV